MADWIRVADAEACPPGRLLGVEADGHRVCIMNVDGEYRAVKDECTHQEYPLSDGELDGRELECIYHGARFAVDSGRATRLPAVKPVQTFEVECRDGGLYIKVS